MDNNEILTNELDTLPSLENATSAELAAYIAEVLDSKKAHDINVIEVGKKTIIAEQFVLCTGGSNTQVRALTDEVEYRTTQRDRIPTNVEGRDNVAWIILDYDSVIVHVFSREAREYYNLDKLYSGTTEMNRETVD